MCSEPVKPAGEVDDDGALVGMMAERAWIAAAAFKGAMRCARSDPATAEAALLEGFATKSQRSVAPLP